MNPLELRGVTKNFGAFTLGPLDLVIPRGYVTGLVGANGAGKTTAMKIALGLVHADAGTATLLPKEKVGVVFDVPPYVPAWKVNQLARVLAPFYPDWDQASFDATLRWAGIAPDQTVKSLSRGMGMKLQLAVALSHGAELLILDEPTSGLDPIARRDLLDRIADFMVDESHAVVFSTHITSDLERVADYVAVLDAGRLVAHTSRDELTESFRVVRGPSGALDAAVRPLVRSLREHRQGWEGLMATEDTLGLPSGVVVEAPSLEDIVVSFAQKELSHV